MEGMRGDMEVAAGTAQAPMAQQELDPPQIHPASSEMRRKGVAKQMGWMAFGRCAACPASRQMLYTARVVMGRVRGWPGKSQGRGFDCCQYCRSNGRSFGDSMTYRSCWPLPCCTRRTMRARCRYR